MYQDLVLPPVKVIWNSQVVAISSKVIPLVHINASDIVGHYLHEEDHAGYVVVGWIIELSGKGYHIYLIKEAFLWLEHLSKTQHSQLGISTICLRKSPLVYHHHSYNPPSNPWWNLNRCCSVHNAQIYSPISHRCVQTAIWIFSHAISKVSH